ncbi:MAG TPA: tetratricopeptide repeat protein [Pyrinomonadaceae bacterium]
MLKHAGGRDARGAKDRVPRIEFVICRFSVLALFVTIMVPATFSQGDGLVKRLEHAAALIANHQSAPAEQELVAILKDVPDQPAALNLLGTIRAEQGKLTEAEALFLRASQVDKHYVGARMNLAYLYSLKGQHQDAIKQLKEVLLLDPANAEAFDRLARLLLVQGQIDDGIKLLETNQTQLLTSSLLVLRGDAYLKQGDSGRAEQSYRAALIRDSEDTEAVLGLAQAAQFRGDEATASSYLARARKMVAVSPDTLYRFALVAMRAGLYEEANGTLLAAIKLKSDDAAYFLALGTTWIKKPDLYEAEKAFRQALQLQPESSQAQMYLGYTLLEQKRYPEAQEWLEKSLRKDTRVPETFYYLGQIAQQQNEDERAIGLFQKAIDLVPSYSFAHAAMGASYLKLRNYPLAQKELELSIKLNPKDSKAHYDLAVLFARLKNQQRAQEELRIVEKLKNEGKSGGPGSTPATQNPR